MKSGWLAVAALLLSGCGNGTFVEVTVKSGQPILINRLHVLVTNGGQTVPVDFTEAAPVMIPRDRTFALQFGSDRTGAVTVDVHAFSDVGEVASASAGGVLDAGGVTRIEIVLLPESADLGADFARAGDDAQAPPDLALLDGADAAAADLSAPDFMADLAADDGAPPAIDGAADLSGLDLAGLDLAHDLAPSPDMAAAPLVSFSFRVAPFYPAGADPDGVALGDFTGDGKLDMIVSNFSANTVSLLKNNGDGTFAAPKSFSVGMGPVGVVTGDWNGDKKLDLAVAGSITNDITILLGNGAGSFVATTLPAGGSGPRGIAAGDFNSDGKLDIAVACQDSGKVGVALGKGDGTFNATAAFAVGVAPFGLAAADLNGDLRTDLAVTDTIGGVASVSVLFAMANGSFGASVDFPVGANPRSVAIADLNGDKLPDLVAAGPGSGVITVVLASGVGTFAAPTKVAATAPPDSVAVGDLNGDGKPDLIAQSAVVSVQFGKGDGTFTAPSSYAAGLSPSAVALGLLDNDNTLDVIAVNRGGASVSVLAGLGNGALNAAGGSYLFGAGPLATSDLNGDGKIDLLVEGASTQVLALLGAGDGTHKFASQNPLGGVVAAVGAADLDGDGFPDLVAIVPSLGGGAVQKGAGNGTFAMPVAFASGALPAALALADLDGNGKVDFAVANGGGGNAAVLLNQGGLAFKPAANSPLAAGMKPSSIAVGSLDGDGFPDLVVANNLGGNVSVLLGAANGAFKPAASFAAGALPSVVAIADVNGDMKADLVVGGTSVAVLLGNGDGTFKAPVLYATASATVSLAVGSVTMNQRVDVVAGSANGVTSVLTNAGDGTLQAARRLGTAGSFLVAADFDADGKLDLAVAGGNLLSVLLNTSN